MFLAVWSGQAWGQTSVVLAPVPQLQFFTQNGTPLSFGCVYTYQSGTVTPLGTYTDNTGVTLNANPVILSAGGSANIWLQAGVAYTFRVLSAGGSNCSSGSTLYTVNGIGGGSSVLTTIVPYSATPVFPISAQNQLFEITLTGNASAQPITAVGVTPPVWIAFQITQDSVGSHTFSWPSNSVGGCTIGSAANQVTTQFFVWNGATLLALGPCVVGLGPYINAGTVNATTGYTSNGLAPNGYCIVGNGTVGNFAPCTNTGNIFQINSVTLTAGDTINFNNGTPSPPTNGYLITWATSHVTGPPAVDNVSAAIVGDGTVTHFLNGQGAFSTPAASFNAPQRVTLSSPVSMTALTQTTILTESVTVPSNAGTYRLAISYVVWLTAGANHCTSEAIDTTNSLPYAGTAQDSNGTGYLGLAASEISSSTYAAGATITVVVAAECNNGAMGLVGATVNPNNAALFTMSPSPPSYLSVTPVLSN